MYYSCPPFSPCAHTHVLTIRLPLGSVLTVISKPITCTSDIAFNPTFSSCLGLLSHSVPPVLVFRHSRVWCLHLKPLCFAALHTWSVIQSISLVQLLQPCSWCQSHLSCCHLPFPSAALHIVGYQTVSHGDFDGEEDEMEDDEDEDEDGDDVPMGVRINVSPGNCVS